ncbi:MAG: hypothetical protein SGJ02_05800 [bacterium]|nr:hypothetical protein [bacterium]
MPTTTIRTRQIEDGAITNAKIISGADIALTKIASGNLIILANGSVAFSANASMGNFRIINLLDPTNAQDAATKAYVDALAQGLKGKQSVRAASVGNLTLSGTQTVDGTALIASDRVLVKDQTLGQNNGIYLVQAGSWTRALDLDTWLEVQAAYVFVEEGSVNADRAYLCTNDAGGTLGTTVITWVQFGSGGGLGTGNFVTRETPSGAINGSNTAFALAFAPSPVASERVFLNGVLQAPGGGNDYTISGTAITYLTAPSSGETIVVTYMK